MHHQRQEQIHLKSNSPPRISGTFDEESRRVEVAQIQTRSRVDLRGWDVEDIPVFQILYLGRFKFQRSVFAAVSLPPSLGHKGPESRDKSTSGLTVFCRSSLVLDCSCQPKRLKTVILTPRSGQVVFCPCFFVWLFFFVMVIAFKPFVLFAMTSVELQTCFSFYVPEWKSSL